MGVVVVVQGTLRRLCGNSSKSSLREASTLGWAKGGGLSPQPASSTDPAPAGPHVIVVVIVIVI